MNLLFQMFGAKLPFPAGSQDHLWFYYTNNNRTFMLDGQGVTAEVVEPDIGATNGVIHVIDRILGVPQHTIGKLLLRFLAANKRKDHSSIKIQF